LLSKVSHSSARYSIFNINHKIISKRERERERERENLLCVSYPCENSNSVFVSLRMSGSNLQAMEDGLHLLEVDWEPSLLVIGYTTTVTWKAKKVNGVATRNGSTL
jgi:hypothetical protein